MLLKNQKTRLIHFVKEKVLIIQISLEFMCKIRRKCLKEKTFNQTSISLNYLKECKEKSEPDLELLLAQLLFKSAFENENDKLREMVFELVPKYMAKLI